MMLPPCSGLLKYNTTELYAWIKSSIMASYGITNGRIVAEDGLDCVLGLRDGHCCQRLQQPQPNEGLEPDMEAVQLWNGVSGVPGLGVSIPRRPRSVTLNSLPLEEWDNHDNHAPRQGVSVPRRPRSVALATLPLEEWDNPENQVPGLGVSIPRRPRSVALASLPLEEWDNHDNQQKPSTGCNKPSKKQVSMRLTPLYLSGVKVELPRVLSPRSSSCRSSGRSTGSLGSSALSQGLSNGSSTSSGKYSKYSSKSDRFFSLNHEASSSSDGNPQNHSSQNQSAAEKSVSSKPGVLHRAAFVSQLHGTSHSEMGSSFLPGCCISNNSHQQKVTFRDIPPDCCCGEESLPFSSTQGEAIHDGHQQCACAQIRMLGNQQYGNLQNRVEGDNHQCDCMESRVLENHLHYGTNQGRMHDDHQQCVCDHQQCVSDHQQCACHHQCLCMEGRDQCDHQNVMQNVEPNFQAEHLISPNFSTEYYKSPRELDGDYSYAYGDSLSPAFLIRVDAADDYSYSGSTRESDSSFSENIYEEINEANKAHDDRCEGLESSLCSNTSLDFTGGSFGTSKNRLRRAFEAVTRRSSRSLENEATKSSKKENFFHLSISKGRHKKIKDKDRKTGSDSECERHRRSEKAAIDAFGEMTANHDRVMSQLKLDVEDMLMPTEDETQNDSGFQSGGMASLPNSSPRSNKKYGKNSTSLGKSTASQMKPDVMRKCESMDFKGLIIASKKSSVFSRTRLKKENCEQSRHPSGNYLQEDDSHLHDPYRDHCGQKFYEHQRHVYSDSPQDSWSELENTIKSNMFKSHKKSDKFGNLPLVGLNNRSNFPSHGNNNNQKVEKKEDVGRTFYL